MSIKILLADDHPILREGVRSVLKKESDIEVVGVAEDGRKALELVRQITPDIVVIDITMPNLNGVDATRQIIRDCPKVKVIALSIHSSRQFVINMLKAGATGYILKECTPEEIVKAIRAVFAGEIYLAPLKVVSIVAEWAKDPQKSESQLDILTDREREVLSLLAQGHITRDIAQSLSISNSTTRNHIQNILHKLNVHSRLEAVAYAYEHGLV